MPQISLGQDWNQKSGVTSNVTQATRRLLGTFSSPLVAVRANSSAPNATGKLAGRIALKTGGTDSSPNLDNLQDIYLNNLTIFPYPQGNGDSYQLYFMGLSTLGSITFDIWEQQTQGSGGNADLDAKIDTILSVVTNPPPSPSPVKSTSTSEGNGSVNTNAMNIQSQDSQRKAVIVTNTSSDKTLYVGASSGNAWVYGNLAALAPGQSYQFPLGYTGNVFASGSANDTSYRTIQFS